MRLKFTVNHVVSFAVFTTFSLQSAPITLPPHSSVRLILNVPEGDWIGNGQRYPQFNEPILSVEPGRVRRGDNGGIRIYCVLCQSYDLSSPGGDTESFLWDAGEMEFWANIPAKPARYALVVVNYSRMFTNVITPVDEGELVANPEPATLLLMAGGLALLAFGSRTRIGAL